MRLALRFLPSSLAAIGLAPPAASQATGVSFLKSSGDGSRSAQVSIVQLAPNDTNSHADVYLCDHTTGATTLVTVSLSGGAGNAPSPLAFPSADARLIVFFSQATDLVPGAPPVGTYLRDLTLGTTTLLMAYVRPRAITPDARLIVCESLGAPPSPYLFLFDRQTGATEQISVNDAGQSTTPENSAFEASITADGRFVAFTSTATNVDPIDTDGLPSIYLRDRANGTTSLVSLAPGGVSFALDVATPVYLSRNGRRLVFHVGGTYPALGDTQPGDDVYLADLATGVLSCVTGSASGGICRGFHAAGISDDGRRLLCDDRYYLGMHPTYGCWIETGRGVVVDLDSGQYLWQPQDAPAYHGQRDLSGDGQAVFAGVLSSGTSPAILPMACPSPWFTCEAKSNSLGCVPTLTFSGRPSLSGTGAFTVRADGFLSQTQGLLYWGLSPAAVPFAGGLRCVAPPLMNTSAQNSGGTVAPQDCTGSIAFSFTPAYFATHGLSAGTTLFVQVYGRDRGFLPPDNIQLSAAIAFTICP